MAGLDLLTGASPLVKAFLAGSMSGTCSTILFQPLDVVKTRLQTTNSLQTRPSMTGEAKSVLLTDGVAGLWRGLRPSLYRTVPGVGLYFSSMHWMRTSVCRGQPSTAQSFLMGGLARTFAACLMIPFTVVKTRAEAGASHRSVAQALATILATEGPRGLARGLGPTLARDVPFSSLYLAFYELLKARLPPWVKAQSPEAGHLTAGLGAGLLASLVTQPADVVKTRMQLGGGQGVLATMAILNKEAGLRSFTAGLAPRMVRRTVMAALAWTVYERVTISLRLK